MIQNILNGIMKVLYDEYPSIPRRTSKTTQGFKDGSFYIKVLNTIQTPKQQPRLTREYLVDVHYFPNDVQNKDVETRAIQDELMEKLEWIEIEGKLIKGLNINAEYQSEVLHIFVTYNVHMIKDVVPDELMQTLIIE